MDFAEALERPHHLHATVADSLTPEQRARLEALREEQEPSP